MESTPLLKKIDEYKAIIDSRRPLTKEKTKELDNYFRVGLTYTSNAHKFAKTFLNTASASSRCSLVCVAV